ncbi:hypothetical protein Bbelb_165570 [Branchiostoma belcheri]|nr:hypothetical protein Bbelb_165570 [Branchiostoma belcheri]
MQNPQQEYMFRVTQNPQQEYMFRVSQQEYMFRVSLCCLVLLRCLLDSNYKLSNKFCEQAAIVQIELLCSSDCQLSTSPYISSLADQRMMFLDMTSFYHPICRMYM